MIQLALTLALSSFQGAAPGADALGEIPGPPAVPDEVVTFQPVTFRVERWGEGGLGPRPPQVPLDAAEQDRIAALKALNKIGGPYDKPLPTDPNVDLETIGPTNRETNPPSTENLSSSGADSDFMFYTRTQGPSGLSAASWPVEPSLGTNGRVIAYCGNTYGLISTDSGGSWAQVNPSTMFGTNICCDQVMYYDRRHELLLWLMQGARLGANLENVYVLGFASGMEDLAAQNFSWITMDPQADASQAAGVWWDFPEMAVTNDHVWFTTNNQNGSGCSFWKFPLDDFVSGGTISSGVAQLSDRQVRLIQGGTTVMYGAAHVDNNTQAIWRAVGTETTSDRVTRDIDSWQNGNSNAPGPDGNNWFNNTENVTHKTRGATCTNDEVIFFWTASEGGGFPFPYWCVSRYSRNDARTYIASWEIWSDSAAWAYGSGHINDRGHVAGVCTYGGGTTYYPSAVAWIRDDYTDSTGFSIDSNFITLGTDGPNAASWMTARWGDYLTTRRHSPYGNTWVGATFTLQGSSAAASAVPDYVWFGRGRDEPPTNRTIYVDGGVTSTWQEGSSSHPYDAVGKGQFAGESGDTVSIDAGSYSETGVFDRPVTLVASGGTVTIN